jgi:hypothetical protein
LVPEPALPFEIVIPAGGKQDGNCTPAGREMVLIPPHLIAASPAGFALLLSRVTHEVLVLAVVALSPLASGFQPGAA